MFQTIKTIVHNSVTLISVMKEVFPFDFKIVSINDTVNDRENETFSVSTSTFNHRDVLLSVVALQTPSKWVDGRV